MADFLLILADFRQDLASQMREFSDKIKMAERTGKEPHCRGTPESGRERMRRRYFGSMEGTPPKFRAEFPLFGVQMAQIDCSGQGAFLSTLPEGIEQMLSAAKLLQFNFLTD